MSLDARTDPDVLRALKSALLADPRRQGDIAQKIGLTPVQLSYRITGNTPFRLDDLERLCMELNIDPVTVMFAPPRNAHT